MSPIIGLTDRPAALPHLGELRKGEPKPERGPGRDLTYFRFTSDERPDLVRRFREVYGDAPPTIWRAFVPWATTDASFTAWREEYGASGLKHRCDGVYVDNILLPDGTRWIQAEHPEAIIKRMKCPGPTMGKDRNGKEVVVSQCKPVGRLSLLLPELQEMGEVTLLTTSINDIIHIREQLLFLEEVSLQVRKVRSLQGIPLIIRRSGKRISTPNADGTRRRMLKSLISVEADPDWASAAVAKLQGDATPAVPQLTAASLGHPDPATLARPDDDEDEEAEDAEVLREIDPTTGEIMTTATDPGLGGEAVSTQAVSGPTEPTHEATGGDVEATRNGADENGGGGPVDSPATPGASPPASPSGVAHPTKAQFDHYGLKLLDAGRLGLDLTPYEIDGATVTVAEFGEKWNKLTDAIKAAQAAPS